MSSAVAGHAFFSHLRRPAGRARYRETAPRRAEGMYERRLADGGTQEQLCGEGLIVLRRAVLAADDLAVLVRALAEGAAGAGADPSSKLGERIRPRLSGIFASGATPLVAGALLTAGGGDPWLVGGYMILVSLISLASVWALQETFHRSILPTGSAGAQPQRAAGSGSGA